MRGELEEPFGQTMSETQCTTSPDTLLTNRRPGVTSTGRFRYLSWRREEVLQKRAWMRWAAWFLLAAEARLGRAPRKPLLIHKFNR